MRFSERWLREWADPPVSSAELVSQLTLAGLEVDTVEAVAAPLREVIIGRITEISPHPEAQRLTVCRVDVGNQRPLQIVCGAPNARVGLCAPVATQGAVLAGGFKIKSRELRGVRSEGMLCSGAELGLEEKSTGLLELPEDAPVGKDLVSWLALDDVSIEVDLTPNRGDCLSVAGMAREVAVINRCPLRGPTIVEVPAAIDETVEVRVESPADCPRYVGRVVRGVNAGAETPLWMRERLRRSGLRSLGPLVDVTNYAMLELGQPMHAFDLAKLGGAVRVRRASTGERLVLLDGQELELREGSLVIADDGGPVALAGIMGGQRTEVDEATGDLFLESAFFSPDVIAGRARQYGLQTDSSRRFERGVDPELARRAMERATALLVEICGGDPGPVIEVVSSEHLPSRAESKLREERIARLLGMPIPAPDVEDILGRLGIDAQREEGGWRVRPPSQRFDLAYEADYIEELARIHGYERIPSTRPVLSLEMVPEPEARVSRERLAALLADRGYLEAVTYSFVAPDLQALLDPAHPPLPLSNPLASDLSVMRTTLWSGLLGALLRNERRQQARVRLFEIGAVYCRGPDDRVAQRLQVAGVASGLALPEQWGAGSRDIDFFDVKADVSALLGLARCQDTFRFAADQHPALHPGQSARVWRREHPVGWVGALHPRLGQQLETLGPVFLFELDLESVTEGCSPQFQELSRFPAIRRDLAIVLDEKVAARQVRACIEQAAGDVLREVVVFDVYRGKGIGSGEKSLALGLTLQHQERTLTDQQVDAIIQSVINSLHKEVGARLRGE